MISLAMLFSRIGATMMKLIPTPATLSSEATMT